MSDIYDSCATCDGRKDPYGRDGVRCAACNAEILENQRAKLEQRATEMWAEIEPMLKAHDEVVKAITEIDLHLGKAA